MIFIYIIGGLVALIVLFFTLGSYLEKKARREAPEKLDKAQRLYGNGDQQKALEFLSDALFVPGNGVYDLETAQLVLKVLELLQTILNDMGIRDNDSVEKLKKELWNITSEPKEVTDHLTAPVVKLLENLVFRGGKDLGDIKNMIKNGEIEIRDSQTSEDFTNRLTWEFNDTINQVGKFLLNGKPEKALTLLNPLIPHDNNDAHATFLEQRAGSYFMMKEYGKALEDYRNIHQLFPGHSRTVDNIRDVEKEIAKGK